MLLARTKGKIYLLILTLIRDKHRVKCPKSTFSAPQHCKGTGNESVLFELPKPECIVCSKRPSDALFALVREIFAFFAFKDPLRIIVGNHFETQEIWTSSSHPKSEEISNATDSGPVPSKVTLMVTSPLGSGDRFRSNSIMERLS